MNSLQQFTKNRFTYYNSLHSQLSHVYILNESDMFSNYGKEFDSILYKMQLHNYRIMNPNYVTESSQDVLFDINEQYAIRDFFLNICQRYLVSICEEYNLEINIDEGLSGGVKSFLNNVVNAAKKGAEKVKDGFESLGDKLKQLKQFIDDVINKTIQTAKELVERINLLMLSLNCNLMQLAQKLGADEKESYAILESEVKASLSDEKKTKENIYETLGNYIKSTHIINESYISNILEKKSEEINPNDNEYDKADKAKSKGKWDKIKNNMLAKAGWKIFLQMCAYYGVTIVLPAVITLIAGPLAGAIAEVICKLLWSSATVYKQVKDMIKTVKSEEYKKSPKWIKGVRWALFIACLIGSIYTAGQAVSDGFEIVKKIAEGAGNLVLPSEVVQDVTKILNDFWKLCTSKDAPGYEELLKAQNAHITKLLEITPKADDLPKEMSDADVKTAQDVIRDQMQGEKASNWNQALHDKWGDISDQLPKGYEYATGNIKYPGGISAWLKTAEGTEWLKQYGDNLTMIHLDSTNAVGKTYSILFAFKGEAPDGALDALDKGLRAVSVPNGGVGGAVELGKIALEPIKQFVTSPLSVIKNGFSAFGGLFPIALNTMKKEGGFNMKLGTDKSNYTYTIESGDIKEMTYAELKKEYGSLNEPVFKNMDSIVNKNYSELNAYKDELNKKSKLSKYEKKKINAISKQLEKMKEGSSEYKMLVFFSNAHEEVKEAKDENENKYKEKDKKKKIPVAFLNPMILFMGDLAPISKGKGPRKTMSPIKGFLASYSFLPLDGGMSGEEIMDFFIKLIKEGLKAAYDMSPDAPFIKKDGKYIENEQSKYKDKNRKDFGMFTNAELTDIFNNPDSVKKYLNSKYYSRSQGARNAKLKDDEKSKELTEKAKKKMINDIENDEKINEFVKKSPSLKKYLLNSDGKTVNTKALDSISDLLIRTENNYLQGKKKKGWFKKIKDFFTGNKDDKESEYDFDSDEVKSLAYKLASKEKRRREEKKSKNNDPIKESLNEEYTLEDYISDNYINNLELLYEELDDYLNDRLSIVNNPIELNNEY